MMSSSTNGRQESRRDPIRRFRYDDLASTMAYTYAHGSGEGGGEDVPAHPPRSPWLPRSHSGRRFVIVAGLVVLVIWGVLYLVFRDWRARYRARAAYGASRVVPAIDPMAGIVPPGVDPADWRDAVDRTRALLVTVTGSNLLGIDEMRALGDELDQAAGRARARPQTAVAELAGLWDAMAERAEFLLRDSRSRTGDRHPRPKALPSYGETRVVPALDPLDAVGPPGVDPAAWRDAVRRTRARLRNVTDSGGLGVAPMKALRSEIERAVDRARAHPETAVAELARLWDSAADLSAFFEGGKSQGIDRLPRPEILPPRSGSLEAR